MTVHGWLCYVIRCHQMFSFLNNNDARAGIMHDHISLIALMNHLAALTTRV